MQINQYQDIVAGYYRLWFRINACPDISTD